MMLISSSSEPGGFELISHPDRTLREHLDSCDDFSKRLLAMKYIASESFFAIDLLEKMRHLLVYFHDFGKGTDYFQTKIIAAIRQTLKEKKEGKMGWQVVGKFANRMSTYFDDFERNKLPAASRELRDNDRLGDHAQLGAYFVLSAFSHQDAMLPLILLKIIRRHHGPLTNFWVSARAKNQIQLDEDDIRFLEKQIARMELNLYQKILDEQALKVEPGSWEVIKQFVTDGEQIAEIRFEFEDKKDVRYFFLQHFLFSLLLSADKGDMMISKEDDKGLFVKENHLLPVDLIDVFKQRIFKAGPIGGINVQRETAYHLIAENARSHAMHHFFSITLPTGLGKTFAAYNAAIILQNEYAVQTGGAHPRIVYCLPFTSIIDQNAGLLEEILARDIRTDVSWLSKNHYLSTYNERYDERELHNQEGEYLTDGWEQEVIVTTFVQMLESIFTNKNRSLRKFHNMTNAIFILDEIQNVPPHFYEAIELVFREMAACFNTKFVFVTATQPMLFKNPNDVLELTAGKTEAYFRQLDRIVLDQSLLQANDYKTMDMGEFYEILSNDIRMQPQKSFLIICNTIAQSQAFLKNLETDFPEAEMIYLSSSILPVVRRWNIRRIKNVGEKQKIVVSTQVVEAGVDIDLDIVYRDFAPIDSINQSAGRCNRNAAKGTGKVRLFNLGKHKRIYNPILTNITMDVLRVFESEIPESRIFDLNLAFAAAVRKKITDDNDKSLSLIRAMQRLELEKIEAEFILIEEDQLNYNVFLPCCKSAENVWKLYQLASLIKDNFERKTAVKKLKPRLLQYVTRFPKNKYGDRLSPQEKENFLIYELDWRRYYDLGRGFRLDLKDDISIII